MTVKTIDTMHSFDEAPLGRDIEIGVCPDPNCKAYHLFIIDESKKPIAHLQVDKSFFFKFYKAAMSVNFKKLKEQARNSAQ